MNKILGLVFCSLLSVSATQAQTLATAKDSLSYALGTDIGASLKNAGFDIDVNVVSKGIAAVLSNQTLEFNTDETRAIIQKTVTKIVDERNKELKKPGEDFLRKNKTNPNVKVTPEGVQYEVIAQGNGALAKSDSEVVVHYKGSLLDGKQFDSSYDRGEPITITLNSVIEGWKIGIPLMNVGSKYKFYVPYNLGYGERGAGEIPPFSTLIFEVELLEIKTPDAV